VIVKDRDIFALVYLRLDRQTDMAIKHLLQDLIISMKHEHAHSGVVNITSLKGERTCILKYTSRP
jgi:hypothetical protein